MYTAKKVGVFPVGAGGALGAAADAQSPGDKAHLAITSPSGGYAFVPCLGAGIVAQYTFDADKGKLAPNPAGNASPPPGSGPRHLAFHPSERFAYGVNELTSTLTTYTYDKSKGTLAPLETKSTLPAGFAQTNTGAEVAVHPNGRFVFASNRGHDSIAAFSIDASSGLVTPLGHTPTGGKTPRSFALDAKGAFLFVANQASDTVQAFRVDAATGGLTALGAPRAAPKPTFVGLFAFEP
jgi:6-phosphogluconolactonase